MQNAPFDEHIKKQLGDYQPEVPSHIWENIVAEKDKRRPAGLWLRFKKYGLAALLATALISAGVYYFQYNKQPVHTVDPNAITQQSGSQPQQESNSSDNIQPLKTETTEPGTTASTTNNTTANTPDGISNGSTITDAQHSTGDINKPLTNSGSSNLPNGMATKNRISLTVNTNKKHNTDIATNHWKKNKQHQRHQKGRSALQITPGETDAGNVITDESAQTYHPIECTSADQTLQPDLLTLTTLATKRSMMLTIKEPRRMTFNIPCPGIEKNSAGNKRYLELYAGPDYAFRSFKDTGNSVYKQKRKESTSFQYAFSAGARYTRVFSNGMSIRAGLNYSQVNEKFTFTAGNVVQIVYIIDASGDTTGSYTATSTRYKVTHNKFRTLDIPLSIGYEMGNGRFHANINAGAVINLYSWQQGDVLDKSLQPVNINTNAQNSPYQFKTNIGLGFIGAVSMYYKLNDRFHLLAEPYFRYNFSPASKSELTYKQKYNIAGLKLGVRYDF